jgi:hypothetical protein
MPRANPKTLCTKWLEQSNAMTDEEHAAMDEQERNRKQLAWYLNANPAYAAWLAKQRDKAPLARHHHDTKPFSIFKR